MEAMLHAMHKRPQIKLLLVGDGDRLEWARVRFAQESLTERLITPGVLTHSALADAYASMDLFCLRFAN